MEENPNLSSKLKKALAACGFSSLTEIQKLAIPEIQKGDNIIISAPTGYGKTLCAFIPFLDRINPEERGIDLLYITPLRSLNRDIFKSVIRLANLLGVEVDIRHGDTTAYERANQVRMPPHCLITTPETLQAMLLSKKMIENLKRVKYIVVDEVQSLMESKRGTQFSIGLERIKRLTNVQIVGLSATIADFDTAKGLLGCTKAINFKGNKQYEVEVIYPAIDVEDEDIARSENVSHVTADGLKYIRN
jgi:ATP-dependent Lhr-like helicase